MEDVTFIFCVFFFKKQNTKKNQFFNNLIVQNIVYFVVQFGTVLRISLDSFIWW